MDVNSIDSIVTTTVELKTPTPNVTRTEQIKTGYKNVNDYSKYLQDKYSFMNTGTISMSGVPTTVTVSPAFLKKCMNDPEKAKYLEENLAAIPEGVKSLAEHTKTMPGSPVCTYATYIIDDNGNITMMGGCTNDPDGRIARENAERKAKEKKAEEEKAAKKREEKKAEEEKAIKRREEKKTEERMEETQKEYSEVIKESQGREEDGTEIKNFSATGQSVRSVTESIISAQGMSQGTNISERIGSSFDAKA